MSNHCDVYKEHKRKCLNPISYIERGSMKKCTGVSCRACHSVTEWGNVLFITYAYIKDTYILTSLYQNKRLPKQMVLVFYNLPFSDATHVVCPGLPQTWGYSQVTTISTGPPHSDALWRRGTWTLSRHFLADTEDLSTDLWGLCGDSELLPVFASTNPLACYTESEDV